MRSFGQVATQTKLHSLPRQQTLRAMVEWSWELLTGAERAVLARLSVFVGGFAPGGGRGDCRRPRRAR
jgi:predicted ATPase